MKRGLRSLVGGCLVILAGIGSAAAGATLLARLEAAGTDARTILVATVPMGTLRTVAVRKLETEGFGCEPADLLADGGVRMACEPVTASIAGKWRVDLDFDPADALRDLKVESGAVAF